MTPLKKAKVLVVGMLLGLFAGVGVGATVGSNAGHIGVAAIIGVITIGLAVEAYFFYTENLQAAKAQYNLKDWLAIRMLLGAAFWLACIMISLIFKPWGAWFFIVNAIGFLFGGCFGIGNALFELFPPKRR